MAFSTGSTTTEGEVKRYIGVAPVTVLAVNPNKAKLEEIYGRTLDKEPEYVTTSEENGKTVTSVRFDFIVKTVAEKCDGIDFISKHTYFIRNEYRFNKDGSKVQVIDKYGNTAWVTKEQLNTHAIPQYSNGPANIDPDYRPCYVGEEDVTNFIKTFLNIPNVIKFVDGKPCGKIDNPEEAEARLDNISKYFTGDYKEISQIIAYQPNNKVKVLFGVKTDNEGKLRQTTFNRLVLKGGVTDFSKLAKELEDRKAAGAYSNVEFEICPIKEYQVSATPVDDLPANSPAPKGWF